MPTCAFCGVNMTTVEVAQRPYDGVVGNYHRDCAYMEYLYNSGGVQSQPSLTSEVGTTFRDKLRRAKMRQVVSGIAAPAGALAASTNLGIGVYKWAVTFVDAYGESTPGAQLTLTTTTGNQGATLTAIPLGPAPLTTARKIYRTAVGGAQLKLLTTISDNTTTTFTDTTADASLGANAPVVSTFAQKDWP